MDTNRNYFSHIAAFAAGIMIMLWFRGCSDDCGNSTTNVKVPEVTGNFRPEKPDHEQITKSSYKVHLNSSKKDEHVSSKGVYDNNMDSSYMDSLVNELLAENEKLSRDFYFASDSLKKLKYDKAIRLNLFTKTFEDENVKIDMSGIVRGEVQSIQPFYTIKEREIKTDIRQKEVKFRMLAGGSVGNSIDFQKPVFSANIGFQNKKGNILRAGFDTEKRLLIGYDFSLFKIER